MDNPFHFFNGQRQVEEILRLRARQHQRCARLQPERSSICSITGASDAAHFTTFIGQGSNRTLWIVGMMRISRCGTPLRPTAGICPLQTLATVRFRADQCFAVVLAFSESRLLACSVSGKKHLAKQHTALRTVDFGNQSGPRPGRYGQRQRECAKHLAHLASIGMLSAQTHECCTSGCSRGRVR
jgi:hypothetical protein